MLKDTVTLWVIGDSTVSAFADQYYYPRYGYGTMLQKYFDENVQVKNLALSGRSSKSYTTEEEYQVLLHGMKTGDFLLIGFGHNDEKTEELRFTDPNGNYKTKGSFANSIYEYYICPATLAGCSCILCTPIVRRCPDGQWTRQQLHITEDTGSFRGGDYSQAIRQLGLDLNLPVIDMTEITKHQYDEMGPDETRYLHAWTSNKAASVDNTHTNIWGARVNAYHIASEVVRQAILGLEEHVMRLSNDAPIPSKEEYLKVNEDYKPTVYRRDLAPSKLWPEMDGWKGTVFGDIGALPMKEHFILEALSQSKLHMAVRGNVGKIADKSDGFAMFYKMIPADRNFCFTAKMKINDYFLNDQVSFGLMARDDMYIDQVSAEILGDYVAAGPLKLTQKDQVWNCFARKNGELVKGGLCKSACQPGDEILLRIESSADGYACTYGEEHTITGGFDFKLTSVDADYVYVGMFVSRNADVTFSDIKLDLI
jgi:hypothetical protein